jgi:hypothetical protein
MATKRYDVVAVTGTYMDRNGIEKKRYMNCGAIFETEKGLSLKLEAYPVGGEGWFLLFEPRESEPPQPSQPRTRKATLEASMENDLPF